MAQISVNNLTFCYEGSFDNIFEKVSFSVDTNWKLGFIGRNGKGKTTFLNILLGKYSYQGNIIATNTFDYFPYDISGENMSRCAVDFIYEIKQNSELWKVICELDKLNVEEEVFSSRFDIEGYVNGILVNVGGKAYIYNSLVAYAVGKCLGISDDDIRDGIREFKLSSSRLEKKVTKKGTILIDDTYNANYDSMKSSIELLGKVKERRKVAIIGDMLELGEYTNKHHTKLGDVVVDNNIDILITIGEYSKLIGERAISLGMDKNNIYSFDKENDSYLFLDEFLTNNDIVLLKASHGLHLIGIVDYLMNK